MSLNENEKKQSTWGLSVHAEADPETMRPPRQGLSPRGRHSAPCRLYHALSQNYQVNHNPDFTGVFRSAAKTNAMQKASPQMHRCAEPKAAALGGRGEKEGRESNFQGLKILPFFLKTPEHIVGLRRLALPLT